MKLKQYLFERNKCSCFPHLIGGIKRRSLLKFFQNARMNETFIHDVTLATHVMNGLSCLTNGMIYANQNATLIFIFLHCELSTMAVCILQKEKCFEDRVRSHVCEMRTGRSILFHG